jgi:hypothetical protein
MYFEDHIRYVKSNTSIPKDERKHALENIKAFTKIINRSLKPPPIAFNGYCRDPTKCFKDQQKIRHQVGNSIRIAMYDKKNNVFIFNNTKYTLNTLVKEHYTIERPYRKPNTNAWLHCETEVEPGKWISTYTLPELSA